MIAIPYRLVTVAPVDENCYHVSFQDREGAQVGVKPMTLGILELDLFCRILLAQGFRPVTPSLTPTSSAFYLFHVSAPEWGGSRN